MTYARLRNLGNYENERLELTVSLQEGEDPEVVYATLKEEVTALVSGKPKTEDIPFT